MGVASPSLLVLQQYDMLHLRRSTDQIVDAIRKPRTTMWVLLVCSVQANNLTRSSPFITIPPFLAVATRLRSLPVPLLGTGGAGD